MNVKKTLVRLVAITAIAIACSFSAGSVQKSYAAEPCLVNHFGCQDEFIDCCCGFFAMCVGTQAQCDAYCER